MSEISVQSFNDIYSTSPALFGSDTAPGLVGCSLDSEGQACTWWRRGESTEMKREPFRAFVWLSDKRWAEGFEGEIALEELRGGQPFRYLARLNTFSEAAAFSKHVASSSGISVSAPDSPQIFVNDGSGQYLMSSGCTYYKGMRWEDVRHLWIYPISELGPMTDLRDNTEVPLYAVCLLRSDGRARCLKRSDYPDERSLLKAVLEEVEACDPDIIAGHQLYDCIMPYLTARAKRCRLKLVLGRCGDVPVNRAVRQKIAEKNLDYRRYDVMGREMLDTWVLAQLYDVSARQMESYDLLDVAAEMLGGDGDAAEAERWSGDIPEEERAELWPRRGEVLNAISAKVTQALSQSYFLQAQIFPYTYQNVVTRGNATRINSLFLREYLRSGFSLPARPQTREFTGGLTAQEFSGLAHDVYHCDVQSLYPSIIMHWQVKPQGDILDIFLGMLGQLRSFRLDAKKQARLAAEEQGGGSAAYRYYNSLQTVFKVLINSFYGYLGFEQGNFADFEAAARVTAQGRDILQTMMDWLKRHGCTVIEVDTDGIYFMMPADMRGDGERQRLISELNAVLPPAINLEFDGHYKAMYCHKMKNYALLDYNDAIILRGSALRARNVEPFLRDALSEMLSLVLHDRAGEIPALLQGVAEDIQERRISLSKLAKTDTLISSPESYAKKTEGGARSRAAAYELALRSERAYKAGDKVTYYVTGTAASVSVWQNAKLLSSAAAGENDANVKYYLSKLKDLSKKFDFAKFE